MVKRNSQRPITPPLRRMIEDMTIRDPPAATQASDIHWVKSFALYISRTSAARWNRRPAKMSVLFSCISSGARSRRAPRALSARRRR